MKEIKNNKEDLKMKSNNKCTKHDWRFEKDLLEGTFFRCHKCWAQGKAGKRDIVRKVVK